MKQFFFLFFFILLLPIACYLLPSRAFADCNYPKFCDTTLRSNAPKPGDSCSINGVTSYYDPAAGKTVSYNYIYSSSTSCGFMGFGWGVSSPCADVCGFLNQGYCCEPKDPNSKPSPAPTGIQPPPCQHFTNGQCDTVATAFGNIPTDLPGLIQSVFAILLSLSGGIAILLIVASGYQLATSQGNPEKVKAGRERLISAIVGLLFIIFSVSILQIIGVDLLHIPGFGK